MRKYKHLFFDLDNTLWDFEQNALLTLKEVFVTFNLSRFFNDFDHFHALFSFKNNQLWELYPQGLVSKKQLYIERFSYPLAEVGYPDEDFALKLNEAYMTVCPTKTTLMPHALETLDYLKPKYKIHLISNGFIRVQNVKIVACGIKNYIENMYLSEAIGYHKPDRRIFEYAIKSSNARKTESVMIGDNFNADIVGARNFGIDQIYYTTEVNEYPFTPTYLIKSLTELKNIL